jgi:hypothetical protein
MRFHEIPWGSMRFYDVPVNQSVPTEANRGLTSYITQCIKNIPGASSLSIKTACPPTQIASH